MAGGEGEGKEGGREGKKEEGREGWTESKELRKGWKDVSKEVKRQKRIGGGGKERGGREGKMD